MSTAARLLVQRLLVEAEPEPEPKPEPTPAEAEPFNVKDYIVQADFGAGTPEITYYQNLLDQLGNRDKKKLANNIYLLKHPDGRISVQLHVTDVITVTPDGFAVVSTYGTPNPKHMYGFQRFGYHQAGYGETARSWRVPFTMRTLNTYLPCGWQIYAEGKSEIPTPYSPDVKTRARAGNWWWSNSASRSGKWDGPGWRVPFSDFDKINTHTGQLMARLPPVPQKGRGSNPPRPGGWGHEDEFHESKKPAPNWTNTSGLFADLSSWPKVSYYSKCPKCGHVHGDYKTMREAHSKRLCQLCDLETVEKIKEIVAHVDDPGVTGQSIARVVGEAEDFNVRAHIMQFGDWIFNAKSALEEEEGYSFDIVDEEDVMAEEPEQLDRFDVVPSSSGPDGHVRWRVYKDEDVAINVTTDQVEKDIEGSPENFNQDWLSHYLDWDKLKRELYYEDDMFDDMEPPEAVERLSPKFLDEEQFFTPTGKFRKITPRLQRLIEDAVDKWKEHQRENFDPKDWLEEMHGKEWLKYAFEAAPLYGENLRNAAENAVSTDGWNHFHQSYNEHYTSLAGGAVAIRM